MTRTRFLPNVKQRKAIKMLNNAQLYVIGTSYRTPEGKAAFDLLLEAERFVRCGFKMPDWRTWMPWELYFTEVTR